MIRRSPPNKAPRPDNINPMVVVKLMNSTNLFETPVLSFFKQAIVVYRRLDTWQNYTIFFYSSTFRTNINIEQLIISFYKVKFSLTNIWLWIRNSFFFLYFRSWWYILCQKCWSKDEGTPSWKPSFWPKLCPQPYCPSYRQFARIVSLTFICFIAWTILYSIVGSTAAPPGGKLFQLILLCICAHLGGWIMSLTTLPALLGMLIMGMVLQNTKIVNIDESFNVINSHLR